MVVPETVPVQQQTIKQLFCLSFLELIGNDNNDDDDKDTNKNDD